ncbi:MAG: hypothetical protein WBS33_08530 [Verrucomicrobiia bacterium]
MNTDGHGFKLRSNRREVLDCGGKRSATPLSAARVSIAAGAVRRGKAVSSLRSATALQDAGAISDHAQLFLSVFIRVHPWLKKFYDVWNKNTTSTTSNVNSAYAA